MMNRIGDKGQHWQSATSLVKIQRTLSQRWHREQTASIRASDTSHSQSSWLSWPARLLPHCFLIAGRAGRIQEVLQVFPARPKTSRVKVSRAKSPQPAQWSGGWASPLRTRLGGCGFDPGQVTPKTLKMVRIAFLLGTCGVRSPNDSRARRRCCSLLALLTCGGQGSHLSWCWQSVGL